ncbi:MAG: potassium transporter KefC [Gammaproteobacteria bacterium]|nr:MAG: potassium transporter KefC [Gammaproteobacteria bacterium]
MPASYLTDIIALLVAAVVAVPLAQALRLGAVPGFLLAGIIVGPSGLGLISNISDISHLSEIGVVFLLFIIGIELKPSLLWKMRRMVFGLGSLQVFLTGLVFTALAYFLFGISANAAILIGPTLALSSTAFVIQLLASQKLVTSTYGRTSIAVLLMQDLAVVPLLALVPLLSAPQLSIDEGIWLQLIESVAIVGLVVFLGRYFLHPILHRVALSGSPEVFTASAVLIVIGTALATEHAGLSMAMGAFLAGMLISDSFYRHQVIAEIQPFRGLLLGMFFMSMGMSLDVHLLLDKPLLTLSLLALLMAIKVFALFPIVYLFGLKTHTSLAVALLLGQSGEFSLVLFSLANQSELLNDALFQQLLLVVLLSMLITPLLALWAERLAKKPEHFLMETPEDIGEAPIVLAGFGRVGHTIGEILERSDKPFVALDSDAAIVGRERANGHPVYYGDVRKPEVLKSAGASNAKVIIVTINDPEATEEIVASLRKTYPDKQVYARGHSLNQCQLLSHLGATGVVSENVEASLELARLALSGLGEEEAKLMQTIDDFRLTCRTRIVGATHVEPPPATDKPL